MISVFRGKKRPFLALFLIELIVLSSSPFLAFAEGESLNIDKQEVSGFLAKALSFLQGFWELIVNNWAKLADSLEQFLGQGLWSKVKQGTAYLENEFVYRKSIFSTELQKEIKEITLDALRLVSIVKK